MKKFVFLFLLIILMYQTAISQIIYSSKIDSLISLVSPAILMKINKELSGDTVTNIGGFPYTIFSRLYESPSNQKAAQYIFEKFQYYGYNPKYQSNGGSLVNVFAQKMGSKYPNKYYIISAHYDNILSGLVGPNDTVHGADDNASGVCGVLEAARLLKNFYTECSIIFIAFDEEEIGLVGSNFYADSAFIRGDSILGVINLDMVSYDGNADSKMRLFTNNNSDVLSNQFINILSKYQIQLIPAKLYNMGGSDHYSFWNYGFKAFTVIEDDFNPHYHQIGDRYDLINIPYFEKMVKASIAALATWTGNYYVNLFHSTLPSTTDTAGRIARLYIKSPVPVGFGSFPPRLYYKVNNGNFTFTNYYSYQFDTLKFYIPGNPINTKVSYYFAFQDSLGSFAITYPDGGNGINPPGSNPPTQLFSYFILNTGNFNSVSTPKPIPELSFVRDTIFIPIQGIVEDVNVLLNIQHPAAGDLFVSLYKDNASSNLTQYNGFGGANYTNTLFDDSALISITAGSPPFTGSFQPQTPLNAFKNTNLYGAWILRIFDRNSGNTGTLLNWSLQIKYGPNVKVIPVSTEIPSGFKLEQNFPNPFNPATKIAFQIPEADFISLKIYNLLGQEVTSLLTDFLKPGVYEFNFDASSLNSGIYFYKLSSSKFIETKKMLLLK